MGIEVADASLSYRFLYEPTTLWRLREEEDFQHAMDQAVDKIRRARKRKVVMEVYNVGCRLSLAPTNLLTRLQARPRTQTHITHTGVHCAPQRV